MSGEVEEQRQRVREVESKMAVMEEQHRQQIKTIALEAERQVAVKEQECQQTITSAYGNCSCCFWWLTCNLVSLFLSDLLELTYCF